VKKKSFVQVLEKRFLISRKENKLKRIRKNLSRLSEMVQISPAQKKDLVKAKMDR